MKKIVILLLALSFLSVDAQKSTKKRTKAKTTKKANATPVEPAAVVDTAPVSTPVATKIWKKMMSQLLHLIF
jgi:hypothetical protein